MMLESQRNLTFYSKFYLCEIKVVIMFIYQDSCMCQGKKIVHVKHF